MSSFLEQPRTKGKVAMHTTAGPLVIELWSNEAPMAARNFVQLCLEGYYDGTRFHRVMKHILQAGDPTGSGTGGESVYEGPFKDEFHSQLRFDRKGLVACTNAGKPDSNGSQFFITLDDCCNEFDNKNTIFGKVSSESISTLLYMAQVETGHDYQPVHPLEILSVEIMSDPFEDIVTRNLSKKKIKVLLRGGKVEEESKAANSVQDKIKSIHDDVLDDPRSKEQKEKKKEASDSEDWSPMMEYGSYYNEDDKEWWECSDAEGNEKDVDDIWS